MSIQFDCDVPNVLLVSRVVAQTLFIRGDSGIAYGLLLSGRWQLAELVSPLIQRCGDYWQHCL